MAEDAFKQPVEGLAFMTFIDGKNILNVIADHILYKFEVPIHGVARLNAETADAVRRHMHTLIINKE